MWSLILLLLLSSPAQAFVEQLAPNGGEIPCHAMGAMLRYYIAPGGWSAAQLGNIIKREWVPQGWSAQDQADNAALLALIDPATQAQKEVVVQRVEDYCIIWSHRVDELNSPEEYRARLGIAP